MQIARLLSISPYLRESLSAPFWRAASTIKEEKKEFERNYLSGLPLFFRDSRFWKEKKKENCSNFLGYSGRRKNKVTRVYKEIEHAEIELTIS